MRLTNIESSPFHRLRYWTSGSGGKPRLRELPFYRAAATNLPDAVRALVLVSDLQGREYLSQSFRGTERLLGEALADELALLVTFNEIPDITAVLVCGDLYDYPDCRKPGGTGEVALVFRALSGVAPDVIAVLGNHDKLDPDESLPHNVAILDGQRLSVAGLAVGGVSGVIGDPKRHLRRSSPSFLRVMEKITRRQPDILLLHQGPEDVQNNQLGDPDITLSLETGFSGMTVFGHTHWDEAYCMNLRDGQMVNVDARVLIVSNQWDFNVSSEQDTSAE